MPGQLGEFPADAPVTALWSGELPGPYDRPTRLTILAVEQPSGALVLTAPFGYAADGSGRSGSSWCATGVLPAGIPRDERVVAVLCDLSDLTVRGEIFRFLVVVAPRAADPVRLLDGEGAVLSEHALADGIAVIRSPGTVAEVAVSTAGGVTSTGTPLVDSGLVG